MRARLLAMITAAMLLALGLTSPASAAVTFTQVSVTVTVNPNNVTGAATIKASTNVNVTGYGLCPKTSAGVDVAFASRPAATITTTGTSVSKTVPLPAGSYTIVPCVNLGSGWQPVGPARSFTVPGGSSPSATPTATPSPSGTPTPTPSPSPTSGSVLFSDDFTGTGAYDHTKWGEWSSCTYNGSAAYANIRCGDRATLDGQGHLSIPATPTTGTSIATGGRFRFTYGTFTARMKVPTQVGYWPSFWALNNNPTGQPNSATVGEIDVVEAYTTFADGYRRTMHNYTPQGTWSPAHDPLCGGGDIRGTWHDYSAKVEPGRVTFFFDGKQCGPVETSTDPVANGRPYAFGPANPAGNWMLLTLAIGGAGGQQKPATAPAVLLVDRVTVTSL